MAKEQKSENASSEAPNAPQPGLRNVKVMADAIDPATGDIPSPPESVNWYLTPICNYLCVFCFFTMKGYKHLRPLPTGLFMPAEDARTMLRRLREAGTKKITFVGGEPTLVPALATLVRWTYELGMTPMIVTNGTGLTEDLLDRLSPCLTDRARPGAIKLSLDSIHESVEKDLGRGHGNHLKHLHERARAIHARGIPLMLNVVVTARNWTEDMHYLMRELGPIARLKFLQVLRIHGQNDQQWESLRVTAEQFGAFTGCHSDLGAVVEDNETMTESYVMVDPLGRFFQNTDGRHHYGRPILEVGVMAALSDVVWNHEKFLTRGGRYEFRLEG